MHLKKLLLLLFIGCQLMASAQFISLRGTNSAQFLSDNIYEADLSHALGAEIYFSKPINFIPLPMNYNIGLDYKNIDGVNEAYLITGLSYVTITPSGFMFATNAESVTMSTYKWLNYFDLNMYNGVVIGDSTYTYKMGGELGYNFGYVLSKTMFLHFGLSARYNYTPEYKEDLYVDATSLDFVLKAGILYKFKRRFNKP